MGMGRKREKGTGSVYVLHILSGVLTAMTAHRTTSNPCLPNTATDFTQLRREMRSDAV